MVYCIRAAGVYSTREVREGSSQRDSLHRKHPRAAVARPVSLTLLPEAARSRRAPASESGGNRTVTPRDRTRRSGRNDSDAAPVPNGKGELPCRLTVRRDPSARHGNDSDLRAAAKVTRSGVQPRQGARAGVAARVELLRVRGRRVWRGAGRAGGWGQGRGAAAKGAGKDLLAVN